MIANDKKTALEWAELIRDFNAIKHPYAALDKASEIIGAMQEALSNTAEREGWYCELAEFMGWDETEAEEAPFVLDLDKAREIATRLNSSTPTPDCHERMYIEGAVCYASEYVKYRLDEFIEAWDELVASEELPELRWELLDDDQRHEAIVRNADRHFEADIECTASRFGEAMRTDMTLI